MIVICYAVLSLTPLHPIFFFVCSFSNASIGSRCHFERIGTVLFVELHCRAGFWCGCAPFFGILSFQKLPLSVHKGASANAAQRGKRPKGIDQDFPRNNICQCVSVKVDARALIEKLKEAVAEVEKGNDLSRSVGQMVKDLVRLLTEYIVSNGIGARWQVFVVYL